MRTLISLLALVGLAVSILSSPGCRCAAGCDDENGNDPGGLRVEPWLPTDLETANLINAVHATADELLVFTPTEFLRGNPDPDDPGQFDIIDKRTFTPELRLLGQPAVNDLVFARGLLDVLTGEEILELQLVQTGSGTYQVPIDSLTDELVAFEDGGSSIGAFNRTGRVYVQPVIMRRSRTLALMFFSIDYNPSFTRFKSIEFAGLVPIEGVVEDDNILASIRFINDFFYVATKRGGYRVSESGVVETVIQNATWIRDFFQYEGDLYASQIMVAPVLKSIDGFNFRPSELHDISLVDVFGSTFISQNFEGWPYQVTDDIEKRTRPLKLNSDFNPEDKSLYYGLDRLDNAFYFGVDRQVYYSKELQAED